jgi:hypothetical protein
MFFSLSLGKTKLCISSISTICFSKRRKMFEFPVHAVTLPTYSDQGQGLSFRAIGRYTAKLSLLRLSAHYQTFNSCNNCVRAHCSILFSVIQVFCFEVDSDMAKVTYEGDSNENLKSAIKIQNTARLSCKLTIMILMV